MNRLVFLGGLLWLPFALLAGCGGGGGNSGGSVDDTVHPATRLKQLSGGDKWIYDVDLAGTSNASGEATLEISLVAEPEHYQQLYLGRSLKLANHVDPINDELDSRSSAIRQAAETGYVYPYAGPLNQFGYYDQSILLPGMWNESTQESYGVDAQYKLKVLGKEHVTVPAGSFDTWRTKQSDAGNTYGHNPNSGTFVNGAFLVTGTYWYAPEVGTFVKARYTRTFTSGDLKGKSFTYDWRMTSTSTTSQ